MENDLKNISSFQVNLFWIVTLCGVLGAFIPSLIKMVLQVITRETELEVNLRRQACELKAELGCINMVDEFAKYAKIKRKMNKVTDELSHQADIRSSYALKVRIIASAILYTLMGFIVLFLTWNYRQEAVAILPDKWLYPFGSILSYPSGVSGGISLTSWLIISSTVGRAVAKAV